MKPSKEYMARRRTGLKNMKIVPYGSRFEWEASRFFIYAPKGYSFSHGVSGGRIYLVWDTDLVAMPGPWLRASKSYIFKMEPK